MEFYIGKEHQLILPGTIEAWKRPFAKSDLAIWPGARGRISRALGFALGARRRSVKAGLQIDNLPTWNG